jgi:tetratricopeptide (TPR) repeat protein
VYAADSYFLKAVAVAKQAIKLDPLLLDLEVELAGWLLQLEFWDEADKYLRKAEQSFLAANRHEEAAAVRVRIDASTRTPKREPE